MEPLEQIIPQAEAAVPGALLELLPNPCPAGEDSLLVDNAHALEVATFLRDNPGLGLDFCSNATGVDWLDRVEKTKTKTVKTVDGEEKEITETKEEQIPGFLEVVYHLYSVKLKHGPLVLRLRTDARGKPGDLPVLPSLTPVWRSAELQEREIYDLFGIRFAGHPDQRRILMWDEFQDHPMRKDYTPPDDYDYEPTPHDAVLERSKGNLANRPHKDGCENIV